MPKTDLTDRYKCDSYNVKNSDIEKKQKKLLFHWVNF